MDWNALKTEYITDQDASYRRLSKKYGISSTAIGNKSRKEGWCAERERYLTKTCADVIDAVGDAQVSRARRIMSVADKLLSKIEAAVDDFEMREMLMDNRILRQITGALKDIKEIQSVKSEADLEEQRARIEKLRREARADEGGVSEIEVTFKAGNEEWNE